MSVVDIFRRWLLLLPADTIAIIIDTIARCPILRYYCLPLIIDYYYYCFLSLGWQYWPFRIRWRWTTDAITITLPAIDADYGYGATLPYARQFISSLLMIAFRYCWYYT